jgi:hypothetical protein
MMLLAKTECLVKNVLFNYFVPYKNCRVKSSSVSVGFCFGLGFCQQKCLQNNRIEVLSKP